MEFTTPQMAIAKRENKNKQNGTRENPINNDDENVDNRPMNFFRAIFGLESAAYGKVSCSGNPIKIEPKVFFANERTFLTWLNSALFICSIGIALASTTNQWQGGLLVMCGVCLILYAMGTYTHRMSSLLARMPSGYHDTKGPVILSILIVTVFLVALFAV